LIVFAYFYPFLFKKEVPKIVFEDNIACEHSAIPSSSEENGEFEFELTRRVDIIYKNSRFRIEVCELPSEEEASRYLNLGLLVPIKKFLNETRLLDKTKESDISIDMFNGKKYIVEDNGMIILRNGKTVLHCFGINESIKDIEIICKWFIEGKMR
jgi:hypothetical protein